MEKSENSLTFTRCHEFPALQDIVYLDHAGATLVSRSQLEAHQQDILRNVYGNPHSRSQSSQLSTDTIDQVRYRILEYFGTTADKYAIIFTAGCTAALKLVAEAFDYHGDQICDCGHRCSRCHSNGCYDTSSADVRGRQGHQLESPRVDTCMCNKRGSFSYLLDDHTSVQGMREIAFEKASLVQCLDCDSDDTLHIKSTLHKEEDNYAIGNHLFAYPAQSNFSGRKYPLAWLSEVKTCQMEWQKTMADCRSRSRSSKYPGDFYTVLDAASFVSTSPLDLGSVKPDFVALSFYKMFGYPTGLGALLVKNEAAHVLKKRYFGGGTVAVSLPTQPYHVSRTSLSEKFEDGTVSFLDIIALRHGFDILEKLAGGITNISQHTFNLARYFHHSLSSCCHGNGTRLADIYCDGEFEDIQKQGAVISFNLLRANGDYVGFSEVDKLAQLYNIHVRTGCFCNIGACQKYLGMTDEQIKHNFNAGHVCGDDRDLIDGKPTGAVRVSFGYMSTLEDAQKCLQFIVDCFLENMQKPVFWEKSENKSVSNSSLTFTSGNSAFVENVPKPVFCDKDNIGNKSVSINSSTLISGMCKVNKNPNESKEKETVEEKSETEQLKEVLKSLGHNIRNDAIDKFEDGAIFKQPNDSEVHLETAVNQLPVKEENGTDEMFKSCQGRHLSEIHLFPVKSCAAFKVTQWPLCDRGLLFDREWMVVTESGIAMSQKRESRLCLLQPSIDLNKQQLTLDFPGMETIFISVTDQHQLEIEASLCSSKVCGDRVQSYDCGNAVADWLSEALCRPGCRLIRQSTEDSRASKLNSHDCTQGEKSKLSLANESQYLLISRDSVAALHQKILDRLEGGDTQEYFDIENLVDRFRGNLVVSGCDAFEEESWSRVQIGTLHFKSQGSCTRCQMVCLDQQTGERSKEPLKTLAVWRGTKVPFGIHLCNSNSLDSSRPLIKVGDPVFVL